jgi:hypothetical protein
MDREISLKLFVGVLQSVELSRYVSFAIHENG